MAALTYRRCARRRSERGAELVELALVMPVLLLVLSGIIDFGFTFKDYEVITNAAREGARMAALPGWSEAQVRTRVGDYLAASGVQGTTTTTVEQVTLVTDPATQRTITGVRVTVSVPHAFMVLGPIARLAGAGDFGTVTLRAVSAMRSEAAAGL